MIIKTITFSAALMVGLLTSSMANAEELRGSAAIQAFNGKSFNCKAGRAQFTLVFPRADPNGKVFPFIYNGPEGEVRNAYVVKKNGRIVRKTGNKTRKIYTNSIGGISIVAAGRPKADCAPA